MMISFLVILIILLPITTTVSFQQHPQLLIQSKFKRRGVIRKAKEPSDEELAFLKQELMEYLEKRKQLNADEEAKRVVGKVVGGTKGNKILEYVSGAPNKAQITEDVPNPLDYDELTKYGYGNLITPIMNAGGRLRMYELLGLDAPAVKPKVVKEVPKLVIDREGKQTRYQGLRLGQILDDNIQAAALEEVQEKVAKGVKPSASKVLEEIQNYERPFADKRNVGPKQTADWTVEKLDEWGQKQGRVEAWARAAKEGAFIKDPLEQLDTLNIGQKLFSILTAITTALAFGKATPNFLIMIQQQHGIASNDNTLTSLDILQVPALTLLLTSIFSSIYCYIVSKTKNRNQFVWTIKGFLGGPLSVRQLQQQDILITKKEQDEMLLLEKKKQQQQ